MKKVLVVLVALLTMGAFVTGVVAQEKKEAPATSPTAEKSVPKAPKEGKALKLQGTVTAYDATAKTLKVRGKKKESEFSIADNAKIKGHIKEGTKVIVQYKKEGDQKVASSISKVSAKKGKDAKKAVKKNGETK